MELEEISRGSILAVIAVEKPHATHAYAKDTGRVRRQSFLQGGSRGGETDAQSGSTRTVAGRVGNISYDPNAGNFQAIEHWPDVTDGAGGRLADC